MWWAYGKQKERIYVFYVLVLICFSCLTCMEEREDGTTESTDQSLNTALLKACADSNTDIAKIKKLINDGADVESRGEHGETPLMAAAGCCNIKILQELLSAGALTNATMRGHLTALHVAVNAGHIDAVKVLAEKGACLTIKDNEGNTPMTSARKQKRTEIANYLKSRPNSSSRPLEGLKTSLRGILSRKKDSFAHTAKSAKRTFETSTQEAPLLEAVKKDNEEEVFKLIQAGADIHVKDSKTKDLGRDDTSGATPLHWAAWKQNIPITTMLLKAGAIVNGKDSLGATPLHWAAANDKKGSVIEKLIRAGADVGARRSRDEKMPLHIAAACNNPEAIRILIDAGADPIPSGPTVPLSVAVLNHSLDAVKELIKLGGVDVINYQPHTQYLTALHLAAREGQLEIVQALVEAGAKLDVRIGMGIYTTPYDYALAAHHKEIADYLKTKQLPTPGAAIVAKVLPNF